MEKILSYPVAVYHSETDNVYYADIYYNDEMFECATYGNSFNEAVDMAKDWIAVSAQKNYATVSVPNIPDPKVYENKTVIYLDIWMPYYLATSKESYQRKNVTVPTWLSMLAESKKINFSQVLTEALKEKLGVEA